MTRPLLLLAFLLLDPLCFAQTNAASGDAANPAPVPPKPATSVKASHATTAQLQAALDQLSQSNRDLLDLLKKQQAVLEDIQFDRRQQSRRIESLEERLTEAQLQNSQLQNKVANLEAEAAVRPAAPAPTPPAAVDASTPGSPIQAAPPAEAATAPPPPASYLPAADPDGGPGTKSWHRLFTLKGEEGQKTDLFHIEGRTWRVVWHNQDKPGKSFQNTSGLFINAFPRDDTIPQRVCAKAGSGGDSTELDGPGNYYLKIEASGGSWELAVEDFR